MLAGSNARTDFDMYKTILVATDGSEPARRAVERASDLAARYGARLVVVHVLLYGQPWEHIRDLVEAEHLAPENMPPVVGLSGTTAAIADDAKALQKLYRAIEAVGRTIVEAAARTARAKGVTEVSAIIEAGDPAERILSRVASEQADIVVVGSRGLGRLEGLILGSVSHKVSQLAQVPCITVK